MSFSNEQIQNAKGNIKKLENLIQERKKWEAIWKIKNEKILSHVDNMLKDIDGKNLLEYAIIVGDIDKVKQYINEGLESSEVLNLACIGGNPEIIKLLKDKKFNYSSKENVIKDTNGKKIIQEIAKQDFIALYEKVKEPNIDEIYVPSEGEPNPNLLHYVAYMNFDEFTHLTDNKKNGVSFLWRHVVNDYNDKGYTALHLAVKCNNLPLAKFLLENSAQVNLNHREALLTPLHFALLQGNIEMVKLLISKHAILKSDYKGRNALHLAILSNNFELVQYILPVILDKKNVSMLDAYGQSPFHYAKKINNSEILALLNDSALYKEYGNHPDYFGKTPKEYEPEQKFIDIDQFTVLNNLRYFLEMTNQDPNSMPDGGHCNGLEFIRLYYTDLGKEDEFFRILEIISAWKGDYQSLESTEIVRGLSGEYKNLSHLFTQWANDIIWFHQSNLEDALKEELNPTQKSRIKQYNMLKKEDVPFSLSPHFSSESEKLSVAELQELLKIFQKLPNTKIEIGGSAHATSIYITKNNELNYYDPNEPIRLVPFQSADKLAKHIKDTKYTLINIHGNIMPISIIAYKNVKFVQNAKNDFEYFSAEELPLSTEDAKKFQATSKLGYTPLHIAVLTDSIKNIEDMLTNPELDLNLKDKSGKTAFQLAKSQNKEEILNILLNFKPLYNSDELYNTRQYILYYLLKKNVNSKLDEKTIDKIINLISHPGIETKMLSKKDDKSCLELALSIKNNIAIVAALINKNIDLNVKNSAGNSSLHIAVQEQCTPEVIKMLLLNGADPNIKNNEGKTAREYIGDNIELQLCFDKLETVAHRKAPLQFTQEINNGHEEKMKNEDILNEKMKAKGSIMPK